MTIAAVIVTCNRLTLLQACVNAVRSQTCKPEPIIVVNNASTDGTTEWLDSQSDLLVVHQGNSGGAGGFYTGFKTAYEKGHDWIWVMDDDAKPDLHCLENLVSVGLNENYTYVPVSVDPTTKKLCWYIPIVDKSSGKKKDIEELSQISDKTLETDAPNLLGSLFHRQVVELAGYPNRDLFIRGDEVEFGLRVQKAGFRSLLVKDAVIYHPAPKNHKAIMFLGKKTYYSYSEPWKAFYFFRNKIYIQLYVKQNLKEALLYSVFILGALLFEDQKLKRIPLYTRAIKDGFLGKLGKTITPL